MRDYAEEQGSFNLHPLVSGIINKEEYARIHGASIIACHDIFIEYKGGILLVQRDNIPAKGYLWPVGGRIQRGIPTEESLRKKAFAECNLNITDLTYLGTGRTLFPTDPFGHGKGTDTLNIVYFGRGKGTLKLDKMHTSPILCTSQNYPQLRKALHPYVQEFMDQAVRLLKH